MPNKQFLIFGNTPQEVLILKSENKMKACLGENIEISLPKAFQIKAKNKTLLVKGVPTEFINDKFKNILDSNKINYAKAEHTKSQGDGRSFKMFQLELKHLTRGKALIPKNLTCPLTGIIFQVEEFRTPISVRQCYNCQVSDTRPKIVRPKLNVSSVEKATHIKDAQIELKSNQSVLTVKNLILLTIKGVQLTKNRLFTDM